MAAIAERRDERRFGSDHGGGARRVAGFERQFGFGRDCQALTVRTLNPDRGDMVERAGLDLYRNLCWISRGVDLVGKFRIPIAKAVGGVRKPAEIAVGAPA